MTTTVEQKPQPKGQSTFRRVVVPILLVALGLMIMLYPVVASQWNNFQQAKINDLYQQELEQKDPEELNKAIEAARVYNAEHTDRPILDPWLSRVSKDNTAYQEYLKQLSGFPAMSQVVIPSINSSLPMYHGTEDKTLQKGLGHLFGTSLPVGGEGTRAVITGHTGITNATLWDNLIDIEEGDAIYISTFGEKMKYEVHGIDVVLPDETNGLESIPGQDLITLITCTPYGVNSHRLLVHAHRVPMDADEASIFDESGFTMQWWMWLVVVLSLIVIALMAWWVARQMKKNKKNTTEDEGDNDE